MKTATATAVDGILSIERIYLNADGNIVVEAILDQVHYIKGSMTHLDPPEYGPGLCTTTIDKDSIPEEIELRNNEQDLEEIIHRYNLLDTDQWEVIDIDDSDD